MTWSLFREEGAIPDREQFRPDTDLELCLAAVVGAADIATLRKRLDDGGWAGVLERAEKLRLTSALAAGVEGKQLTLGQPKFRLPDGRETAAATLERRWRAHVERRALLLARLTELVLALNAEGMVPVLLKGARSLWTGEPEWRSMRDLDVLVPGEAQERAQAMAREMGYTEWHEQGKGFHHGTNLYRPDMPGWIEIHRRAATGAADILLPTPQLVETSVSIMREGAEARVLRPDYDLLHALAHHHLGHRGARDGVIDLKGLVEFADQFARLGDDDRVALGELVARDPRRIAMLDLWLASAHERLGLTIRAPFVLVADAQRRARRIAQGGSGTAGNIVSEIGLATNGERLRRAVGGQSLGGRMRLRLRIFRSVFRVAKLRGALRGPRP